MALFGGWRLTRTGALFIAGVVVLAVLVFGGVWLARERGEQVRRDEAIKIAEQNLEAQAEAPVQTETQVVTEEATTNESSTAETVPTNTSELPQTGIEASQVFIITILALALGYYLTSRRALRHL